PVPLEQGLRPLICRSLDYGRFGAQNRTSTRTRIKTMPTLPLCPTRPALRNLLVRQPGSTRTRIKTARCLAIMFIRYDTSDLYSYTRAVSLEKGSRLNILRRERVS